MSLFFVFLKGPLGRYFIAYLIRCTKHEHEEPHPSASNSPPPPPDSECFYIFFCANPKPQIFEIAEPLRNETFSAVYLSTEIDVA
jgi:hypothetical protein